MFEAGLFGTLEDLFLGAKGGVENFGRSIEDVLVSKPSNTSFEKRYEFIPSNECYQVSAKCFSEEVAIFGKTMPMQDLIAIVFNSDDSGIMYRKIIRSAENLLRRSTGIETIAEIISRIYNFSDVNSIVNYIRNSKLFKEINNIDTNQPSTLSTDSAQNLNILQHLKCDPKLMQILMDAESGKISNQKAAEMINQMKDGTISFDIKKFMNNIAPELQAQNPIDESMPEMAAAPGGKKDILTPEEAIMSTETGRRLFTKMKEAPAAV